MGYLAPLQASLLSLRKFDCDATFLQPSIERNEIGEAG